MLSRQDMLDAAPTLPYRIHGSGGDVRNSISSSVLRCTHEGRRAVALGADADVRTSIMALLDLLHLQHADQDPTPGTIIDRDAVVIILGRNDTEAVDALCTLRTVLHHGPRVEILVHDADDQLRTITGTDLDLADAAGLYPWWAGMFDAVTEPPQLVRDLVKAVERPVVRAYPMLSGRGRWSLRVEGLEIGRAGARTGSIGVGKDGRTNEAGVARRSAQRAAWQKITGLTDPREFSSGDRGSIDTAVTAIRAFADSWLGPGRGIASKQDEHALESRVLRGAVRLTTSDGRPLDLIRAQDDVVNWGSQFPAVWGRGGSRRYLDALLRDGSTPWAVEMKVDTGAGAGRYYRHAIGQAVLYREFIRRAEPLHPWFHNRNGARLEPTRCHAAIAVPALHPRHEKRRASLQHLCDAFEVDLIEVPAEAALIHRP